MDIETATGIAAAGGAAPESIGARATTVELHTSIAHLAADLALAQGEITGAVKGRENPFFKSTYATLADVWDACRAPLAKHGLAVIQLVQKTETGLVLETILAHKSGQQVKSTYPIVPVKNDPQGIGSAITYARRYSLAAVVGVAPADDDDDGEAASGRGGADSIRPAAKGGPAKSLKDLKPPPSKSTSMPAQESDRESSVLLFSQTAERFIAFIEAIETAAEWEQWKKDHGRDLKDLIAGLPDGELKAKVRTAANVKAKAFGKTA